jgi:hypothetical protein
MFHANLVDLVGARRMKLDVRELAIQFGSIWIIPFNCGFNFQDVSLFFCSQFYTTHHVFDIMPLRIIATLSVCCYKKFFLSSLPLSHLSSVEFTSLVLTVLVLQLKFDKIKLIVLWCIWVWISVIGINTHSLIVSISVIGINIAHWSCLYLFYNHLDVFLLYNVLSN